MHYYMIQCHQEHETAIQSTCVWVDNTAAIAVAMGNDFTHETVKHVTVKVRFLQECVRNKIVLLVYIKTCKNLADIITKQSTGPQFRQHRDYALGYIIPSLWHMLGLSSDAASAFVFVSRLAGV